MPDAAIAVPLQKSRFTALSASGRAIFALATAALGVETLLCARTVAQPLGAGYNAIPVLPWIPAIPWLAILFGAILVLCALGLFFTRTMRSAAFALAGLFTLCALILVLPRYIASPGDMGLRTVVFEPLSLACFAVLLLDDDTLPLWLSRTSRALVAVSFIVFGVDHLLALAGIGTLIPGWIPWHVFWIAFFGVAFIAAALSIGLGVLEPWGAIAVGLMFAIWVVTLHIPRTLGFLGIPGAIHDPDEWSSLFIAIGLWGGSWAIARQPNRTKP